MNYSDFGNKFSGASGILHLMEDLGNALQRNSNMLMLGGGNPANIPPIQAVLRARMESMLEHGDDFERTIGNYETPRGHHEFVGALAELLRARFGWPVSDRNIALTAGSQSGFFLLFNLFAGTAGGRVKKILLPMMPEYIGYFDVGLTQEFFTSHPSNVKLIGDHSYKYYLDVENLTVRPETAAMCVSRPTNPTGNVLTDKEIDHLMTLSRHYDIPLIIDNAYGLPFPNIVFTQATPVWNENIVFCMSLSKLGLPGVRTGIVIANENIAAALSRITAVTHLAISGFGPMLVLDLVKNGDIVKMSREIIGPYYQEKAQHALACFAGALHGLPYRIHQAEGAIFLWVWLKDLPIPSRELYQRLKQRNVLIVPGEYFFTHAGTGAAKGNWSQHSHECIRVSYSQPDAVVERGIAIIAEEARKAYAQSGK